MVRALLLLVLFSLSSLALDITIKSAKELGENYSILRIQNDKPFTCSERRDSYDRVTSIVCLFDKMATKRFKPLKSTFFKLRSVIKKDRYFIVIEPFYKMKLFANIFDLTASEPTFEVEVKKANRWMIVGYVEQIPYIKPHTKPATAIAFPITLQRDVLPYVGALDINSKPVHIANVEDVNSYLELKKLYSIGKYELVLELCNEVLDKYKDSIFISDVMLYKIRALHELGESEEVIALAKEFMREYSSNIAMAEVLAYTARAYSKIGLFIDADYFYDRVFDEHSDSKYAQLAMVYKAEQYEESGDSKKAMEYLKKALYATKDIDIAVDAAFKIAKNELEHKRAKSAAKYIEKIAAKKGEYFNLQRSDSMEMATTFYDLKAYKSSYIILKNLLEHMTRADDEYERLLSNIIQALSKMGDVDKAMAYIDKYNKMYREGEFSHEVQVAKDSLFFENEELNVTAKLAEYDELIARYGDDVIAKKALYKKANLLYANGFYKEVMDLNSSLEALEGAEFTDATTLVDKSVRKYINRALKNDNCQAASDAYFRFSLRGYKDEEIFTCSIALLRYKDAKSIAKSHLQEKDIATKTQWLYRYAIALYNLHEYDEFLKVSSDIIALSEDNNYSDIYRMRFDAFRAKGLDKQMLESIITIEKRFNLKAKDIERYVAMVIVAQKLGDDVMVQNYATKVMQIQKRFNIHSQTPFIEFSMVESLLREGKSKRALKVVETLHKEELSPSDRARAYYLLGSLYTKLSQSSKAKVSYEKAIQSDKSSPWAKLAKDALELL